MCVFECSEHMHMMTYTHTYIDIGLGNIKLNFAKSDLRLLQYCNYLAHF